ncbi:MAG: hypothetical protein R3208_02030 [Ketobacteraceae bacterium]|nr:hypothetical protein [Ketobacteraceae bacterium]
MEKALILLTGSLLLALFIERLIEVIKSIYDAYEVQSGRYKKWNHLSARIADQLHTRITTKTSDSRYEDFHLKLVSQYLFTEDPDYKGSLLVSTDRVRTIFMKYLSKLVAVVLGILFAWMSGINVFVLVEKSSPANQTLPEVLANGWLEGGLGLFITGIIMGLGAGPMHKFIVALERARKKRKNTGLV